MHRKKILFIVLFINTLHQTPLHALPETCPTVEEIKNHRFHGWLPLYKSNEELATSKDVVQFKEHVTAFQSAQWNRAYLENGHCFYQGTENIVNTIIFAKDAWRPAETAHWSWVTPNIMAECYSQQVTDCGFM
ncbi:MAG TPA: hypothetical protein VHZ76_01945 [Gammaproteobacteria bacterium]|jgi:hypothetical protein|nr:hypothetical protein [Gammaproteobacteria bacterium]